MQENESLMITRRKLNIPSLGATAWYHSASLVMPTITLVMEISIHTSQSLKILILFYPYKFDESFVIVGVSGLFYFFNFKNNRIMFALGKQSTCKS